MDTNGRAEDKGPAEDYLRYFTDHFTDDEWETIKRSMWMPLGECFWEREGNCGAQRLGAENRGMQCRMYLLFVFTESSAVKAGSGTRL